MTAVPAFLDTAAEALAVELEQEQADIEAVYKDWPRRPSPAAGNGTAVDPGADLPEGPAEIDWADFWNLDHAGHDWLVEPLLPAGRQVVIFSPAKAGKSLLALEVAAAVATGRPILHRPASNPQHVVYIDMEMTADDLRERLQDLGYGPADDLTHLHYYLLPMLPPLDTQPGGVALETIVTRHQAVAVVLDTMARVVDGEENAADTYRNFYKHTGSRLKRAGVALLRLDHAGKQAGKGQRGSSAKRDDVDVIWRMTVDGGAITLSSKQSSRVSWVPETVQVERLDHDGRLRHVIPTEMLWPAGTAECAADLDNLGVPLDATVSTAGAALKRADRGRRNLVVAAGVRYRKGRL